MAAPITDGWLVEVNNFSHFQLPGLTDYLVIRLNMKVGMIFDTASICFLIRISLADHPARARLDWTDTWKVWDQRDLRE